MNARAVLTALCLPLTAAASQPSPRPTPSRVALPAQTLARVGRFLDQLSATMPAIARTGMLGQRGSREPDFRPLNRFAMRVYTFDYRAQQPAPFDPARALRELDSLRMVWEATDTVTRAYWLIPGAPYTWIGSRVVAALLDGVVADGALLEPARRFADALSRVDAVAAGAVADATASTPDSLADIRTLLRARASETAHLTGTHLRAMVHLARGDTAAAMVGLRQAMRTGYTDDFDARASLMVEQLAAARQDTATRAEALGMLVMSEGGLATLKAATYQRFLAAYPVLYRKNPQLPQDAERYLDNLFQTLFDRDIPVTRYASASRRRMAILEYRTGLGCGACWGHDRVAAALLQRYPADALGVIAYEYDCPPLSNEIDAPQTRITEWYRFNPSGPKPVVQYGALPASDFEPRGGGFPLRMADPWLNGLPALDPEGHVLERKYAQYAAEIDRLLSLPPEAIIAMRVTSRGGAVDVALTVDSIGASHRRVAARIVLVEDTVRVKGGTNRRLQYSVVRGAAQSPGLPMGLPLSGAGGGRQTVEYHFDLDTIAAQYVSQRTPRETLRKLYPVDSVFQQQLEQKERSWNAWVSAMPDPADSRIDRDRLHVIAFVQDLDTGDILQATRVALGENAARTASAFPERTRQSH